MTADRPALEAAQDGNSSAAGTAPLVPYRKYMPIMTPDEMKRHPYRLEIDAPIYQRLPMALFAPHERQAQKFHSQTLERLAQRGGLSACEAVAILEDRDWHRMSPQAAYARLDELARAAADAAGEKAGLTQAAVISSELPSLSAAKEEDRMRAALKAAQGYLMNAQIDLETGAKKATALNTIKGGIELIRAALLPAGEKD